MTRRLLLVLAATPCGIAVSSSTSAQSAKEFSTLRLYPAVGQGNFIGVDGARVGDHLATSYGAFFDVAGPTLTVDRPCSTLSNVRSCDSGKKDFVATTGLVHLTGSVSLLDRIDLGIDLPVGFTDAKNLPYRADITDGTSPARELAPHQGFTFADARLRGKTSLWRDAADTLAVSVAASSTLPTAMLTSHGSCREAGNCAFTGERGINAGVYGIGEATVNDFRFALNAGVAYRPSRSFLGNHVGTELTYGGAAEYAATPLVRVTAEVAGAINILGYRDYPIEARGSVGYGDALSVQIGGGAGLYGDTGSPTYRVFGGLRYAPVVHDLDQDGFEDNVDACPSAVEDKDGFMDGDGCPDLDNDADGIPDAADGCRNEPEDKDSFQDEDGCPDRDNDGDGVEDGYDSCEGVKEDLDGDRDDDGCPDFDTDRDGLRDDLDKCPDQAEDRDGLADGDGCPEEDFDGDGIKDPDDACPEQPESWNGVLDTDGCPEEDADHDGVSDELDACPDQAESLNGKRDEDGCPDGPSLITLQGNVLRMVGPAIFEDNKLAGEKPLVATISGFVQRNHRRGKVRLVLITQVGPMLATPRLLALQQALEKRLGKSVLTEERPGATNAVLVELLP